MQLWPQYSKSLSLSILGLILLVGTYSIAAAQRASVADENLAKAINETLTQAYKPNEPGASVIVVKDGKVIFRKGYGMANLELAVPVEPDMVFRLGSITKQFTAVAILMLAEQGKLSLDDDLTKFLPDYPTKGQKITITKDGNKLMAQATGQPKLDLFPESPTKFFVKEASIQIEFVVDGSGQATSLVIYQAGQRLAAKKIK